MCIRDSLQGRSRASPPASVSARAWRVGCSATDGHAGVAPSQATRERPVPDSGTSGCCGTGQTEMGMISVVVESSCTTNCSGLHGICCFMTDN
eukprot:TRINITY_DN28817_c0_g1_i1.p1 TRINITY_DN28817_c0_g1~~TRINITY_DN28817_c0_g1_i1.p1  ORF type:complete len:107 (+),score=0.62 TRINITY_DN28817_c0_g1_i1:44-322(+)